MSLKFHYIDRNNYLKDNNRNRSHTWIGTYGVQPIIGFLKVNLFFEEVRYIGEKKEEIRIVSKYSHRYLRLQFKQYILLFYFFLNLFATF